MDSTTHVMIDLEALQGYHPRPEILAAGAITSIGAVVFDPLEGVTDKTFLGRVALERLSPTGIDGETLAWWLDQPSEVKPYGFPRLGDGIDPPAQTLSQVLGDLRSWLPVQGFVLWSHYYDRVLLLGHSVAGYVPFLGYAPSWCDYGSLKAVAKSRGFVPEAKAEGLHNPVEDARRQARDVVRIYKEVLR